MVNRVWCVYVHTNLSNGKCYVGITSLYPAEKRWNKGKGYKTQPKFYSAIQEFGWDGFGHKILETGLTEEKARQLEKEYIILFDSLNNGYNSKPGGEIRKGRPVMLAETGQIYEDAKAAAKVYNTTPEKIRGSCRQHYAAGGWHWLWVTEE